MKTRNTFTGLTAGVLLLSLTFLTAGCGGRDKTPSPTQVEPTISTESYEDTSTESAPTKTMNPETMEITTTEISLLDNTEY